MVSTGYFRHLFGPHDHVLFVFPISHRVLVTQSQVIDGVVIIPVATLKQVPTSSHTENSGGASASVHRQRVGLQCGKARMSTASSLRTTSSVSTSSRSSPSRKSRHCTFPGAQRCASSLFRASMSTPNLTDTQQEIFVEVHYVRSNSEPYSGNKTS